MKKTILLPILLLGLTLASCGSNKAGTKGEFKDYKYDSVLNDDEAALVRTKVLGNVNKISSAEMKGESYEEEDNTIVQGKGERKITVSSEGYVVATSKDETKVQTQGLTFTEKHETATKTAYAKQDETNVRLVLNAEDGVEGLTVTNLSEAEVAYAAENASAGQFLMYFLTLAQGQGDVFKTKKGYEIVVSTIDEEHLAVDWDQGYKEKITINKSQIVYTIDAEYRATSLRSVQEKLCNRDAVTGAWYDKVKVVEQDVTTAEAKYDAKASNAQLASDLVAKGASSVLTAAALEISAGKAEGDTLTGLVPVAAGQYEEMYNYYTGVNSKKFGYLVNLQLSETVNAYVFEVSAMVKKDVFTAAAAKASFIAPELGDANITNKTFTIVDQTYSALVFGEGALQKTGILEFEVVSSADAIAISSVTWSLL